MSHSNLNAHFPFVLNNKRRTFLLLLLFILSSSRLCCELGELRWRIFRRAIMLTLFFIKFYIFFDDTKGRRKAKRSEFFSSLSGIFNCLKHSCSFLKTIEEWKRKIQRFRFQLCCFMSALLIIPDMAVDFDSTINQKIKKNRRALW